MALDVACQAAVERNDAAGTAAILADDFVLVNGTGRRFDKTALLDEARRASRSVSCLRRNIAPPVRRRKNP